MKVFALYNPATSHLIRIWSRSWMAHGWKPRLISPREVSETGSLNKAVKARGGGVVTETRVINFSVTPRKFKKRTSIDFGLPGWKTGGLVLFFPDVTEDKILNCGRPLKHVDRRT